MDKSTPLSLKEQNPLHQENLRLKQELKRQKELYENSHQELIQGMVESALTAEKLHKTNQQLRQTFLASIEIIQRIIDLRKPGYYEHASRVAGLSKQAAVKLKATPAEINAAYLAARIHEIGKMHLPDTILNRTREELSEKEILLIKNQYSIGAHCLENIRQFRDIARVIKHIRENVDGSGLPDGLSGAEIPLGSRIIAMSDFFDTVFFVHHIGTVQDALERIYQKTGVFFDEDIFDVFQNEVRRKYSDKDKPIDRKIVISQLEPGLVLSRDLKTITNVLLLPKDSKLDEAIIAKVIGYQQTDPLKGGIYVYI